MNGHKSTGIQKMIFANASTNHAQPHTTGILQPALANAMMLMVKLQALKPIAMINQLTSGILIVANANSANAKFAQDKKKMEESVNNSGTLNAANANASPGKTAANRNGISTTVIAPYEHNELFVK